MAALAGRSAIVTPAHGGCVVVFDEESEEQNTDVITMLTSRLSREFGCRHRNPRFPASEYRMGNARL
jgi:hypothetical protein